MKDKTQLNKEYYSRIYSNRNPLIFLLRGRISFDQQSKTRLNLRILSPIIKQLIEGQQSVRVLDYGCGWGTFLLGLPRSKIDPHCFDIAENVMRILEKAMFICGRKLHRVKLNGQQQISPDGFNVILCSHVIEHVDSDQTLLEAFQRALRPEGYLLLNVPINEVWEDPRHVQRYDANTLAEKMREVGFRILGSWEEDRWTAFLLKKQVCGHLGPLGRAGLRALRAILAIAPLRLVSWSENVFLRPYPPQQLLMLGGKADD